MKKIKVSSADQTDSLSPKDIKTSSIIICISCKSPSGYENEDFINIKPPRDIKCKNCKEVCIKLRNSFELE